MTIASKLFYWVECDGDACGARCPTENDDSIAYTDRSAAYLVASESDWIKVGMWDFCPDCGVRYCRRCGQRLTADESDVGEYTCFACAPELVEQNG